MIINQQLLLKAAPIIDMIDHKVQASPTSYGLTECGYDIRIKQDVVFNGKFGNSIRTQNSDGTMTDITFEGNFVLGSSIEKFEMPNHLMGRVLNKSTWARKGLDASMTTNIEPKWEGYLTLELVYHGNSELFIPAGSGICQVIFENLAQPAEYVGKYQDQINQPVPAK